MFAKRFFFVCAGLLCLALVYHLGATSAAAQGGGSVQLADLACCAQNGAAAALVGRTIYRAMGGAPYGSPMPPIPGTADVVAISGVGPNGAAILANGEHYYFDGRWVYAGNLLDAPTPAQQSTWGSVKARYR